MLATQQTVRRVWVHGVLVNTPHECQEDTMTETPRPIRGDDVEGHIYVEGRDELNHQRLR